VTWRVDKDAEPQNNLKVRGRITHSGGKYPTMSGLCFPAAQVIPHGGGITAGGPS